MQVRALSSADALAASDCRVRGVSELSRPDHGVTGSYSAWPALAAEALAKLDDADGWRSTSDASALALLRGAAASTAEGPFGQAHELREDGIAGPPFKSLRGLTRYSADAGAAFVDVALRGLGAFSPKWIVREPADLLDAARTATPRGVEAHFLHVRTPFGEANLSLGAGGVRVQVPRSNVEDALGLEGAGSACRHERVECVQ